MWCEHTVSVSTDSKLLALLNLCLDHGGLVVNNILYSQDDLENVLPMDLLAVLESLNHIVDVFLCHLVAQLSTIVAVLDNHVGQIQTL